MSKIRNKKRRKQEYVCHLCGAKPGFCWTCKCGFQVCTECMKEKINVFSCNGVTWFCPECDEWHVF